jgi:GNAT superfamily N-acetyltransferase
MQEHLEKKDVPATYVAFIDDQPVGSASVLVSDMPEKPELTPWLASVYVLPECRRQKVGRALVKKIMDHVRNAGIKRFYLYTPDREHFYAHMGWQTIEKMQYHGADVTLMYIDQ